jgi:hypothetical protein
MGEWGELRRRLLPTGTLRIAPGAILEYDRCKLNLDFDF